MNYTTAQKVLKSRTSRKIGNHTYLKRIDECTIGVLLHDTYVVKFTLGGVELTSDGWRTPTTKDRINTYAPVTVIQSNSLWYVAKNGYDQWDALKAGTLPLFYDGITLDNDGNVTSETRLPEKTEKKTNALKKRIRGFVDLAVKQVLAGKVGLPSGGDCWHCSLTTTEGEKLGDSMENVEHLENHIQEKYVVPSLLWNAVSEAGYKFPEIILGYDRVTEKTSVTALEFGVRNSLRKYLTKRLLKNIL